MAEPIPPFETGTSFPRTCLNALNTLSGLGLITMSHTLAQAGWSSLGLLVAMAIVTCYTGLLLKRCMDSNSSIKTYTDILSFTFGKKGSIITSALIYLHLFLVPTGFLILEGDNLHKLFPHIGLNLGGHRIGGKQFFTVAAGLAILPTMFLKDLSLLSYISAGGVFSSIIIVGSIMWVGAVDGIGFSNEGLLINLTGIPTAISLYAFSYGAHPIFPTLYTSMRNRSQFSKVLFISFGISTLTNMSMAVIGYLMFGQSVSSQITLNLPASKISSKIAIYTTLVGPLAKFALVITPLATAIESCFSGRFRSWAIGVVLRMLLLGSTVIVALVFPYFGILMALVGAILDVTFSILVPCLCTLKIFRATKRWGFEAAIIVGIMVLAISIGLLGTYSSMKEIVKEV